MRMPRLSIIIFSLAGAILLLGLLIDKVFIKSDTILSDKPQWSSVNIKETPVPTEINSVQIGLMGDLGLGRFITTTARRKNDYNWSFSGVSSWLKENDFNLANLESPIISHCPEGKTGTFTFCGDEKFLPYLQENKFYFNLANNHILNYGRDGLAQTEGFLTNNNIPYFYSHSSQTEFIKKDINGISFGFIGFDLTGAHLVDKTDIVSLVKKYDKDVDWLIVSLHWGNEYKKFADRWQIDFARQLIDGGADIIAGHHPHVIQPDDVYKDKLIFYSLGNFIFDQNWSQETSRSTIVRLVLTKERVISVSKTPIIIKSNSRPEIVDN